MSDRDQVKELCDLVWEGNDYVPGIFHSWVSDKEKNLTFVDVYDNKKIISFGNCNILAKYAWVEGIRIHPDFRRIKLAQGLLRLFELSSEKLNLQSIGFSTGSNNIAMNRIAEKTDYKLKMDVNVHFLLKKEDKNLIIPDLVKCDTETAYNFFKEYQEKNDFIPLSFFGLNLNDDTKQFFLSNYRFWKADNFIIVDEFNHLENSSTEHHFSIFKYESNSFIGKSTLLDNLLLLINKYKKNKAVVTSTLNFGKFPDLNKYFEVTRIFRLNYYQKLIQN